MGDQLAVQVDEVHVTGRQRDKFLDLIRADRTIGDAKALRQAGVAGTTGQLRAHITADEELAEQAREARGYGSQQIRNELQRRAFAGSEDQASGRILLAMAKAHLPEYRDSTHLEVTGANGGPMGVIVEHDYDRLVDKLELVGLIRRGPAAALDAESQRLLPAPPD